MPPVNKCIRTRSLILAPREHNPGNPQVSHPLCPCLPSLVSCHGSAYLPNQFEPLSQVVHQIDIPIIIRSVHER